MRRLFGSRNAIPEEIKEIKKKLKRRQYYISPHYGLILKNRKEEYVIADIRFYEKKVFVPYANERTTPEETELMRILSQEQIPKRNKAYNA